MSAIDEKAPVALPDDHDCTRLLGFWPGAPLDPGILSSKKSSAVMFTRKSYC